MMSEQFYDIDQNLVALKRKEVPYKDDLGTLVEIITGP